jgi:hypothetical protein
MSFTTDLLQGLAQYLAAAGIGTYRPTGAYLPSETAIAFDAMPPDPDRAIVLSDYPVSDDPSLSDSVVGIQIRTRGLSDPLDVKSISDAVFALLHGANWVNFGTVRVVEILRNSGIPMGRDENLRWERSDNYYATVNRPSTNRI